MSLEERPELGVCVVGCGAIGRRHAAAWERIPNAGVVAVADVAPEHAAQVAQSCAPCEVYTDHQLAICDPRVDVVSVCVPTHLHAPVALWALRHHKHVLCEKPIALELADAEAMVAAADEHGVYLGIGFMRRYSPLAPVLKSWIDNGALGRPVWYHARDARSLLPQWEMYDARANGGPLLDMAVHYFDFWSFLFDARPLSLYADGISIARFHPALSNVEEVAPDSANLTVRYASGDVACFAVCWGLPPGMKANTTDLICGPGGMAQVEFYVGRQEIRLRRAGEEPVTRTSRKDLFEAEIESFAHAIAKGTAPVVNGADGVAALRSARAALESLHHGKIVAF